MHLPATVFAVIPSVTCLVIAFLSYFRSRRHRAVIRFALLNLAMAGWNFGEFAKSFGHTPETVTFWIKFALASASLIYPTFVHFILRYTGDRSPTHRRFLIAAYCVALGQITTLFHPTLFMAGYTNSPWGAIAVPGPFYSLHVVAYVFFMLYAFILLGRHIFKADNRVERNFAIYLFLWGGLASISGFFHFTPVYGLMSPPLGHAGTFLFSLVMFYLILRYRIMDIRLAFRKGIVLTATLTTLTGVYLALVLSSESIIYKLTGQQSRLVTYFGVMVFAILFQPFQRKMSQWGNRIVFPVRHHARALLFELVDRLSTFSDTESLAAELAARLQESMAFDCVAVYLWNEGFERFDLAQTRPADCRALPAVLEPTAMLGQLLNLQELSHRLRVEVLNSGMEGALQERVSFLQSLDMLLCVPIKSKDRQLGILMLGHKKVYSIVDEEDTQILQTLASRAGTALSNILSERRARAAEHLAAAGRLSATIAHEIKNPLGAIRSSAQLLKDGKGGEGQLDIILEESERLNRVLWGYLDFARPLKLDLEEVDWNEYLGKIAGLLRASGDLEFIPHPGPCRVVLDLDRVRQVLVNLYANARRSAGDQGRITLRSVVEGPWAVAAIEDNGPGFSAPALRRAFEPFFTTFETGTGLGLAISRKIVEEHNGRIGIENLAMGGARVKVQIPMKT